MPDVWSPVSQSFLLGGVEQLKPIDVLYYYDGPTIFLARVGFQECLFYKVDEQEGVDLFLVAPTNHMIVEALKSGTLSVRGAIQFQSQLWLSEVDRRLNLKRSWTVSWENMPDEFRPRHGIGVAPRAVASADSLEQATAFFSVKFSGDELNRWTIPFVRLKSLVDGVYASVRQIFPAPSVVGDRAFEKILGFDVFQPRLASLIIAVKEPTVDLNILKKADRARVNVEAIRQALEANRQTFFETLSDIVREADRRDLKHGFAAEHYDTLSQVNELVPTERRDIDIVEFRAQSPTTTQSIVVDDRLGDRIRNGFRLVEKEGRHVTGKVVEVNAASETFVIVDKSTSRQITCVLEPGVFRNFEPKVGERLRVRGAYGKRIRRDRIFVKGEPQR